MDDSQLVLSNLAISKGCACMILWKHILRRIVLLTESLASVCLRLRASNQRLLPRVRQDTDISRARFALDIVLGHHHWNCWGVMSVVSLRFVAQQAPGI